MARSGRENARTPARARAFRRHCVIIRIQDNGSAVYVGTTYSGRDDWRIDEVTGTTSTVDDASWAALHCIAPTLGMYDHTGFVAGKMRDAFYCMAAAAHFASKCRSLDTTPQLETAVEVASCSCALENWMCGALAHVMIGVVMERSIRVPATPIEDDEWLPLISGLLQAAAALDLQSLFLSGRAK